jgi:DNA-binding winged helix-turn-helix (wHTH) protein
LPSYTFGPFRLDSEAAILFRRGEPVALGPRAVGLLRVLVERSGVPVSKDTLMETAWTGLAVEESNLPVQIAALRRVLSEAPGGDRWIETLPRRGLSLCRAGRRARRKNYLRPRRTHGQTVARGPAVQQFQR